MDRSSNSPSWGAFFGKFLFFGVIAALISTLLGKWFWYSFIIGYPLLYLGYSILCWIGLPPTFKDNLERNPVNQQGSKGSSPDTGLRAGSQSYAGSKSPSTNTDLVFVESAGGLEKDNTAGFVMPKSGDEPIRFECGEFQAHLPDRRTEIFFVYDKIQHFEPIQIGTHNSAEWWWFRGNFYKVEYEKGRPSADFAGELAASDADVSKASLLENFPEEGYSPDEIAEGVFEMMGETETALEHANRLDMAQAIITQAAEIMRQDERIERQDLSHDYGLEQDTSARIFTKKSLVSTQVCIESNFHQPPEVLFKNNDVQVGSELQNYHPILIDKKTGRGGLWKSEVVAEWWWFKGSIYLAKRERAYQSNALSKLKEDIAYIHDKGKSQVSIPKYTVGKEFEDRYKEGYAPEEIARLVFALRGEQERLGARFDRIRAAKHVLNPKIKEPWNKTGGSVNLEIFNRERVEEYLQERKQEGREGRVEAREGGYWSAYKQWVRGKNKEPWSRAGRSGNTNLPKMMELYSVVSTSRKEHRIREQTKRAAREVKDRVQQLRHAQQERAREEARRAEKEHQEQIAAWFQRDEVMEQVHYMEGVEFEHFMADMFRKAGYSVKLTPASGDQGTDLLLEMDDRRIAVQTKRYTRPVGNDAVQATIAGMFFYKAQEAWLITTSSFTRKAVEAAKGTGVRLIDGNELNGWVRSLRDEQ